MRKLKPKVNIERHTLEIAELEARIRELENLKLGYQDELGWLNELLEKAEARVKELEKDNNDLIEVNHSVSVCRNHTSEITNFDGCLVCRIEELEGAIKKFYKLATRQHYYCEDCWYTCPKHPEGCCNDDQGTDCNCGADEHNKKVEKLYAHLPKPSTDNDK